MGKGVNTKYPVIMIGLDGAEFSLIQQLMDEGRMPHLRSLCQKGCVSDLRSSATVFSGGVWPTFYTAKDVPWHGIYHNMLWNQSTMDFEYARADRLPEIPFWEILSERSYRTAVIDVPMVLRMPRDFNGLYLAGWGTHDVIASGSRPSDLWKRLNREFGPPRMEKALWPGDKPINVLFFRDRLLDITRQMADIGESVMGQEDWDLFLFVLGALHRGGHYLWDLSQVDTRECISNNLEELKHSLLDIYMSCDEAVGRLLQKAPDNARILIFSLHGMGPNPGWCHRLETILNRISGASGTEIAQPTVLRKLHRLMPRTVTRQLRKALPKIRRRIMPRLASSVHKWETTRFFPMVMDHAGYIRINLKGREKSGVIEQGREYEKLCADLKDSLLDFRDTDTHQPIIQKVYLGNDLAPSEAPYHYMLPDLVLVWGGLTAAQCRGITSSRFGEIFWENPAKIPSGRSGNHRDNGFLIASGPGIPADRRVTGYHIQDLAPTVFACLNEDIPSDFQGRVISPLLY